MQRLLHVPHFHNGEVINSEIWNLVAAPITPPGHHSRNITIADTLLVPRHPRRESLPALPRSLVVDCRERNRLHQNVEHVEKAITLRGAAFLARIYFKDTAARVSDVRKGGGGVAGPRFSN